MRQGIRNMGGKHLRLAASAGGQPGDDPLPEVIDLESNDPVAKYMKYVMETGNTVAGHYDENGYPVIDSEWDGTKHIHHEIPITFTENNEPHPTHGYRHVKRKNPHPLKQYSSLIITTALITALLILLLLKIGHYL